MCLGADTDDGGIIKPNETMQYLLACNSSIWKGFGSSIDVSKIIGPHIELSLTEPKLNYQGGNFGWAWHSLSSLYFVSKYMLNLNESTSVRDTNLVNG